MSNIDHDDLADLGRDIDRTAATITPRLHQALARRADDIAADARRLAPVRTGHLKQSISATTEGLTIDVGASAEYAEYVEMGTSDTGPQPFLRPAFDRNLPRVVEAVARLADEGI